MRFRVIGLWVVLIVMFVGFYQFFSAVPADDGGAHAAVPKSTLWMQIFLQWLPVLILVLFFALFLFFFRGAQKGAALNQEGVTLLQQGRYTQALEKFQQALPKLRANAPLAHHNIGIVKLSLWRPAEAEGSFDKALEKKTVNIPKLSNLVIPQRALARALAGKLDPARNDLEEAARLGAETTGTALVAAGVIAARSGEWRRAADLLNRYEVKQLGGVSRGLAEALLAWSTEKLTGEKRYIDLVALYGETGPETVRQVWPELVAFLNAPR